LWVKTNENCEDAYESSEATATKSSSDSIMVSELMVFLRGLRLAMGRKKKRRKLIGSKTW